MSLIWCCAVWYFVIDMAGVSLACVPMLSDDLRTSVAARGGNNVKAVYIKTMSLYTIVVLSIKRLNAY